MKENSIFDEVLEEYIDPVLAKGNIKMSNDLEFDTVREELINLLDARGTTEQNSHLMKSIEKRFTYLRLNNMGNDELLDNLAKLEKDMYLLVLDTLQEYYDFKLNLEDGDLLFDNLKPLVDDLYSFFVEDYKANLIVAFHSYIITNEEENSKKFSISAKTKDLAVNSMKSKFQKDPVGIMTLHFLNEIMDMAIAEFKTNDSLLLDYIKSYDEDELTFIRIHELFVYDEDDEDNTGVPVGVLGSDFIDNFLRPITDGEIRMSLKSTLDGLLTEEYIHLNA